MWTEPPYDCQECGACCANYDSLPAVGYVCLDKTESKRMKRLGLAVVQEWGDSFLGTRPYAGAGADPICVAFRGEVGGGCSCSIYACRPRACQRFEVGSSLCRTARQAAGLLC